MNQLNFPGGAGGRSTGEKEEKSKEEDVEPPTSEDADNAWATLIDPVNCVNQFGCCKYWPTLHLRPRVE